jgi:ribose transport system permease protein
MRPQPSLWRRAGLVQARFPVLQVVALAAVYTYGAATLPRLATWSSIKLILVFAALAALAAVGQTLLILIGGFDLSIPGFIVASGLMVTHVSDNWGVPFSVALLVTLSGAAALGALAGQICHRLDIQPLVVTLGTGAIALGLAQSQTPAGLSLSAGAPSWLVKLASPRTDTFGVDIPPLVAIWVVVAVAMTVFLHRTVAGRHLLATGANPRAAEYSLIATRRIWTFAFAFSAIASSLVGLAVVGLGGGVTANSGNPYLFLSVVAVIVGGTIFGGPGDYLRTSLGALLVTVVGVVLVGHGAGAGEQQIIFGVAILLVVALYGRERRIRDRV